MASGAVEAWVPPLQAVQAALTITAAPEDRRAGKVAAELGTGLITRASVRTLVAHHSGLNRLEGDTRAALGGLAGTSSAAWLWIHDVRTHPISLSAGEESLARADEWALGELADLSPIAVQALAQMAAPTSQTMHPRWLKDLDQDLGDIDIETRAALQQLLDEALADALRQAGLTIQAAVKDPVLLAQLKDLPLDEVWDFSAGHEVRPGVTVLAAVSRDEAAVVSKVVAALRKRVERLLNRTEREANERLDASLPIVDDYAPGISAVDKRERIRKAVDSAAEGFTAHATNVFGQTVAPSRGEPIPAGTVPPQVARRTMAEAGGNAADEGMDAIAQGLVRREALRQRLEGLGAHLDQLEKSAGSVDETAVKAARAKLARAKEALDPPVINTAKLLASQRAEITSIRRFRKRKVKYDFEPHRLLNGKSPELDGWEVFRNIRDRWTGLEFYQPGDHNGCRCLWILETVLTLVPRSETFT